VDLFGQSAPVASQADSAGSIPVTRSNAKAQVRTIVPEAGPRCFTIVTALRAINVQLASGDQRLSRTIFVIVALVALGLDVEVDRVRDPLVSASCRVLVKASALRAAAGPAPAPGSAVARPARRPAGPHFFSDNIDQHDSSVRVRAVFAGHRHVSGGRGVQFAWCLCGCLTRFGSCLRMAGRSTRHDPFTRPLHTGKFGPHGASASRKHHAAAARFG